MTRPSSSRARRAASCAGVNDGATATVVENSRARMIAMEAAAFGFMVWSSATRPRPVRMRPVAGRVFDWLLVVFYDAKGMVRR